MIYYVKCLVLVSIKMKFIETQQYSALSWLFGIQKQAKKTNFNYVHDVKFPKVRLSNVASNIADLLSAAEKCTLGFWLVHIIICMHLPLPRG